MLEVVNTHSHTVILSRTLVGYFASSPYSTLWPRTDITVLRKEGFGGNVMVQYPQWAHWLLC